MGYDSTVNVRPWANPIFSYDPSRCRTVGTDKVRDAGVEALRLNMKDGCGMVGENLFLEGT